MIIKVYSVFDSKVALFSRPYFSLNDNSMLRSFSDALNEPGQNPDAVAWNRHPEDYSLFYIGEYDDLLGKMIPELPKSIITAAALKNIPTPPELAVVN